MIRRTVRPAGAVAAGAGAGGRATNGAAMPDLRGNGPKQWSPTVANLLVILVLELVAFAAIRYLFRRIT